MIYPSVEELTQGRYNRYMLCIATAKCARIVTEQYCEQREEAIHNKDDKLVAKLVANEEKPVQTAVNLIYSERYKIILPGDRPETQQPEQDDTQAQPGTDLADEQ